MTISDWYMFSLKGWQPFVKRSAAKGWFLNDLARAGWHPFAERSAAKGWFANRSAITFGCAEKAATPTTYRRRQTEVR